MKEIVGDLWNFYQKPGYAICITTNGAVKKNGEAVMGRGCALEATKKILGVALDLGNYISVYGNTAGYLYTSTNPLGPLVVFPVKEHWRDQASLDLIAESTLILGQLAYLRKDRTFLLPRPGCGNGRLSYDKVFPILDRLPDNVHVIDFAVPVPKREECGHTSGRHTCEKPKGHTTEGPYGYHESYGWHGRSQERW